MTRNIGLVGWILCSKQCAMSLLDGLVEKDIVEDVTVREGVSRLTPDPFGNYLVTLHLGDSSAPSVPPEEYLCGEPTYCGACGSLCSRPLNQGQLVLSSGSVN